MQQRILVIEDNPADAAIIHIYLEEAAFGHVIHQADSLRKGFEILNRKPVDLALLDLSLTDSTGFGTLEKFLKEFPHIPVIVMTGLNNDIVGVQCVRAGAQDFLVKGEFDSKTLVKSIRHSLQRFQTQTKLKESAQKLSIQQKRTQEAQELARFANWEMDMVTNAMKWADEMYRIFGIQSHAAALSLSDYFSYVYFDDREKVETFFTDAMQDEEMHKIEHRIVVGNRVKFLSVRAKVSFDEASNHLLLIGSAQDVTDQTASGQVAGNRAAGEFKKKDFMAELANQVQKPLFDALGLAHLLQKTASPTQSELVTDFRADMEELWLTINNLLCAQMIISGAINLEERDFSTVAFFQHFAELAELKARRSGSGFRLTVDPAMPYSISADEKKLSQVCFNVLKCALSGRPHPQVLSIEACLDREEGAQSMLRLTFVPGLKEFPAGTLRAILEDADFSYITDPLLRTKAVFLAVCGHLVRAMGGRFSVAAENDMCAILNIWIPVKVKNPSPQKGALPVENIRILLVDDHALHRIAGRSVLAGLYSGAAISLAESAGEAESLMIEHPFDLVLLDLQMPETDGFSALPLLRKHADVPFIAISSVPGKEEEARCLAAGFKGYLGKPLRSEILGAEIQRAFSGG